MVADLKKKVLNLVNPWIKVDTFGLDISDLTVKYFKFGQKKPVEIAGFGEISIPPGIIESGEIKKEEELERILSAWLSGEGRRFRSSFAAVSLPEEKGFLRLIQIPKIKLEDIGNAVRWEIEANIPLPLNELIYDFEAVIPPENDHLEHLDVMITAFPKTIVESYARVLQKSGLALALMESEAQAIVRSLLPVLGGRGAKIVADIGRERASIVILAGQVIVYTTTVGFKGKQLEESIVRELGVTAEEAVLLKKEKGLDKKEYQGRLFSALASPLAELAEELKKTIAYYQTHATHAHNVSVDISEIFLVGGDANLLGIDTYLASVLKTPVLRADPLAGTYGKIIPPINKNEALGLATAVGLALRGNQ